MTGIKISNPDLIEPMILLPDNDLQWCHSQAFLPEEVNIESQGVRAAIQIHHKVI